MYYSYIQKNLNLSYIIIIIVKKLKAMTAFLKFFNVSLSFMLLKQYSSYPGIVSACIKRNKMVIQRSYCTRLLQKTKMFQFLLHVVF